MSIAVHLFCKARTPLALQGLCLPVDMLNRCCHDHICHVNLPVSSCLQALVAHASMLLFIFYIVAATLPDKPWVQGRPRQSAKAV